jgi:hypothetical protein
MNEFREAMKDQAKLMATKEDIERLRDRLGELEADRNVSLGKADQSAVNRANTLAVIGLGIAILSVVLRFF